MPLYSQRPNAALSRGCPVCPVGRSEYPPILSVIGGFITSEDSIHLNQHNGTFQPHVQLLVDEEHLLSFERGAFNLKEKLVIPV
jgi:hypothetical protein